MQYFKGIFYRYILWHTTDIYSAFHKSLHKINLRFLNWSYAICKTVAQQSLHAVLYFYISRLSKVMTLKKIHVLMYSWGKEVMWKSMWNFSEPPFFMKAFDKKWTRHRPYHLRCHVGELHQCCTRSRPQLCPVCNAIFFRTNKSNM